MSIELIALSGVILGILLLVGKVIRLYTPPLQKYYIPSSIVGGLLGLVLGPQVWGATFNTWVGNESGSLSNGVFPEEMIDVWKELPKLLITVVFATIFFGKEIPKPKKVWKIAGPQVAFGQTVAWGQYVIGILLALFILTPMFGLDPIAGALIEISFEGGIGSASGLAPTFTDLGFEEAGDLAVGLATVGLISGLVIGIVLLNWGARKGHSKLLKNPEEASKAKLKGFFDEDTMPAAGKQTTRPASIETLTLHFSFIAGAIFIGFLLLKGLQWVEKNTWEEWTGFTLMEHFPLFPLAMVGSVILQVFLNKYVSYPIVSYELMQRINGLALDFMVVSAIASLSLTTIGANITPFLILAVAGITLNVLAFLFIARIVMPDYWFERGIGDFGQSMGMTAIGLLLMRIADPERKSPAVESFGYKQLLFEPVVGGGFFTAAAAPLIAQLGPVPVLIITGTLCLGWLAVGYFYFGKKKGQKGAGEKSDENNNDAE